MSIKYALLGLLAHTPRHGYDLKTAFETCFSQMRLLNTGQIYQNLNRLKAEGLVEGERIAQATAPARQVYRLTPAGHTALRDWLARPVEDSFEETRSEFFLKLLVQALVVGVGGPGWAVGKTPGRGSDEPGAEGREPRGKAAESTEVLARHRANLLERLEDLRRQRLGLSLITGSGEADPRSPQEQEAAEVRLLLLEGALLHLEADLRWLDLVAGRLDRLQRLAVSHPPLTAQTSENGTVQEV